MQIRTLLPITLAALSALSLNSATAQGKKETSRAQQKNRTEKAGMKSSAAGDPEAEVVGSIDGKSVFTFGQFLTKLQKDNPPVFSAAVSAVVGPPAVADLFGPSPKSQFSISKKALIAKLRANPPQSLGSALGNYLSEIALQQAGAKEKAAPTDAQLDDFLSYLLRKARKDPNAGFTPGMTDDQFLKARNLSRDTIKKNLKTQVLLLNLLQKQTEDQLKHKIQPEDFVQARHILIKAPALTADSKPEDKKADADALAKLTLIAADIQAGKVTFEDAAKKNSEDGSAATGGDLGIFMDDNSMVKEFQDASFSLKTNEISKPVRSQFGYHLIQVTKKGKDISDDDRRESLIKRLSPKMGIYSATVSRNSKIENRLMPAQQLPMNLDGQ